jgi:hypothetical protein
MLDSLLIKLNSNSVSIDTSRGHKNENDLMFREIVYRDSSIGIVTCLKVIKNLVKRIANKASKQLKKVECSDQTERSMLKLNSKLNFINKKVEYIERSLKSSTKGFG